MTIKSPVREPITVAVNSTSQQTLTWRQRLLSVSMAITSLVLGLPICLIALESVFAIAHVGEEISVNPDALLGYSSLPNQRLTYRLEGFSRSRINQFGFRDRVYPPTHNPAVKRIAVLGDSIALGFEVAPEKTFAKVLEKKLAASNPGKFEVMNCAMSGYGTGQEYLLYTSRVAQFHPDLIVLAYHMGDIDDNAMPGTSPPRPEFKFENSQLLVDWKILDNWLNGPSARFYYWCDQLRRKSRVMAVWSTVELDMGQNKLCRKYGPKILKPFGDLWAKLENKLPEPNWQIEKNRETAIAAVASYNAQRKDLPVGGVAKVMSSRAAVTSIVPYAGVRNEAGVVAGRLQSDFYHGYLQAYEKKKQVSHEILRALHYQCTKNGARLAVVTMPAPSNSMFYFRELADLKALANRDGFDLIETHKTFPPLAPMEKSPYYFAVHFTAAGHELVARDLLRYVQTRN